MGYLGSKGGCAVWRRILTHMPRHDYYVEPYLGSGVIMRRKLPSRVMVGVDIDPDVIHRCDIPGITRIVSDGASYIRDHYMQPDRDTVIYCDPPYVHSTRSERGSRYKHEMSDGGHERLLVTLLGASVNPHVYVMLSGYRCALYDAMLSGWRRVDYTAMTRGGPRTESLWMSYDPSGMTPHDTRYVGRDHTDRQRIKRLRDRWVRAYGRLSANDRRVILAALEEAPR